MLSKRSSGILLATIVGAVATSAIGQVTAPPFTSGKASVPDFSGFWSHPYWPGFEPPLSGPGPILNKMRRKQLLDADGLRLPAEKASLVSEPFRLIGDFSNPILKPAAAEAVKKHGELEYKMGAPTPSNQCWPQPVPYVFWQLGMQMLQQSDKLTILYGNDQQVRHIRLNAAHQPHITPSWYGDSVGHYEGGMLVIDTVGIKPGPFPMVDMYGTPRTDALHVVERYRLIDYEGAKEAQERAGREIWRIGVGAADGWTPDPNYKGKGLQLIFTVEDDGVLIQLGRQS